MTTRRGLFAILAGAFVAAKAPFVARPAAAAAEVPEIGPALLAEWDRYQVGFGDIIFFDHPNCRCSWPGVAFAPFPEEPHGQSRDDPSPARPA